MWRDKQQKVQGISPRVDDAHAVFIGWQRNAAGDTFALYNITLAGHPLRGSTVTDRRLRGLNLRIPHTPSPPATGVVLQSEYGGPEIAEGEVHER